MGFLTESNVIESEFKYATDYISNYNDRTLLDSHNAGTCFFDQNTLQIKVWDGFKWMVLTGAESTLNKEVEIWIDCPRCGGSKIQNSKCDWCGM